MPRNTKVKGLDELAAIVQSLKAGGKKIVHAHGVFDLLHVGHIRYLEEARAMGDVLVVTLTRDEHVNKGPHRPAFPQDLRAEALAALSMVDYVSINHWPTAVETIKLLRPDIYAKGPDYKIAHEDITGGITLEADAVQSVGGEIRFTDDITFSASSLLNRYFSAFPPETERYLDEFRRRHSIDEVLSWLDKTTNLKPLVVGEAIIDEYLFGDVIGKSTKDPVLALLQQSTESYAGGTLAIANHLAGLCREVRLVTQLGDTHRREDFVRLALRPNVESILLTKSGSPTIHKRRIVDRYTSSKLLEIYVMEDRVTADDDARLLVHTLEQALVGQDLTIIADYGHGMMTKETIDLLGSKASFLAVNVQSNAGNRGFNPISKYRRADYVCIAAHEVQVETRQRTVPPQEGVMAMTQRIECPRFTITLGKLGSIHYAGQAFTKVPALATRVLDRVGAGDAVLAVTALLAQLGTPWDIVGFVGNVAGAELVAELGNRVPLERVSLSKHITTLLK